MLSSFARKLRSTSEGPHVQDAPHFYKKMRGLGCRLKPAGRACRKWVFPFLGAFILLTDPLGLSDATDAVSHNIVTAAMAPYYPEQGRSAVSVVLINEETLAALGEPWPLSTGSLVTLLRTLQRLEPDAVFLDVVLSAERGTPREQGALAAVIRSMARPSDPVAQPIDVYLADLDHGARTRYPCTSSGQLGPAGGDPAREVQSVATLPALACAATDVVPVQWLSGEQQYPLLVRAPNSNELPRMSAALSLYRSYCARGDCGLPKQQDFQPGGAFDELMTVRWGSRTSPEMAEQCGEAATGRLAESFRLLFSFLVPPADGMRARCPYTDTVPAHYLLTPARLQDPVAREQAEALLRQVIQDRVVLIGTGYKGSTDQVLSPLHGKLPGVYQHAMAVDNLISGGSGFWRDPGDLFGLSVGNAIQAIVFLLASLIILVVAMRLEANWKADRAGLALQHCTPDYCVWRALKVKLVGAGLVIALILVFLFVLTDRYPPFNWVGMIALASLAIGVLSWEDSWEEAENHASTSEPA